MKTLILVLAFATPCFAQYYGSSSQAVRAARGGGTIERNPGPSHAWPHGNCLMCLGNSLMSRGYSYAYLNSVGYQNWGTLWDNSFNPKPKPKPVFAPTPMDMVSEVVALADLPAGGVFVDLGSGDGRVVVAIAEAYGVRSVGIELDPDKIDQSRALAISKGVDHLCKFIRADVIRVDLSKVDVVYSYLEEETLRKLMVRFREMRSGSRLISYQHKVPGLPGGKSETETLYVWDFTD